MAGYVKNRFESREPVEEWVKDPTGYPLQITLDLINKSVDGINPLERAERVDKYGIGLAKLEAKQFAKAFGNYFKKVKHSVVKGIQGKYEARSC